MEKAERRMRESEVKVYQIGDKVVHPMYGAGVVDSIVQKTVDNIVRDYYILQLPNRSMVVMVPTENCGHPQYPGGDDGQLEPQVSGEHGTDEERRPDRGGPGD